MSRIVRLLAYLSVLMLVVSGGTFAHAVPAHSHADLQPNAHESAHEHVQDVAAEPVAKAELHCGAPILQLTKEYELSFVRKKSEVEQGRQKGMRVSSLTFEPPPPKTAS
ncbi:hypothetical protein [Roseibium sp.]|uniref:hypothetical protein n=1 Tax=Roseibium sp. TaxID=1936156 RepID=UPI003D10707A